MIESPELPVVDDSRCTGCGACVDVCPAHCLAMSGAAPWLPRPADCIMCHACAIVCPVKAIEMKPHQ